MKALPPPLSLRSHGLRPHSWEHPWSENVPSGPASLSLGMDSPPAGRRGAQPAPFPKCRGRQGFPCPHRRAVLQEAGEWLLWHRSPPIVCVPKSSLGLGSGECCCLPWPSGPQTRDQAAVTSACVSHSSSNRATEQGSPQKLCSRQRGTRHGKASGRG